jgi:salicylate hydroxylase
MGQGAAMAIEDAVSIATLLSQGTAPETIRSRLEMYETSRRPRVEFILHYTRLNGRDENDTSSARMTGEFLVFLMKHPEADNDSRGNGEGHRDLLLTQCG